MRYVVFNMPIFILKIIKTTYSQININIVLYNYFFKIVYYIGFFFYQKFSMGLITLLS